MKNCKDCGKEVSKSAKTCPNCGRRLKKFGILRVLLGIFVIFVAMGILASLGSETEDSDKCYISLAEFNKIENGMSYDQVKEIVGCEGTVNSDTQVMDTKMTIYSWYGKDGISNANVTIENDKLINKTQIGLK